MERGHIYKYIYVIFFNVHIYIFIDMSSFHLVFLRSIYIIYKYVSFPFNFLRSVYIFMEMSLSMSFFYVNIYIYRYVPIPCHFFQGPCIYLCWFYFVLFNWMIKEHIDSKKDVLEVWLYSHNNCS